MKTNTCRAICLWAALGVTVWLTSTTMRAQSRLDDLEQRESAAKVEAMTNSARKRKDRRGKTRPTYHIQRSMKPSHVSLGFVGGLK
jgi:hypothetical protein